MIGRLDPASFEFVAPRGANKMIKKSEFSRHQLVGQCDAMPILDDIGALTRKWSVCVAAKLTRSTLRQVPVGNLGGLGVQSAHAFG